MRFRLASILVAVWGVAQGYFLYQLGSSPSTHAFGWSLCFIAFFLALSLLTKKNWARIITLVAAIIMLTIYGYFVARNGAPQLSAWLQPVLALVLVVILLKPPSNKALQPTGDAGG